MATEAAIGSALIVDHRRWCGPMTKPLLGLRE